MKSGAASEPHERIGVVALLYLLFVVYGSLIPFAFTDRALDQVLSAFLPPPWIPLGATDRADWIANALLYMPLAFLALEATCAGERGVRKGLRAIVVLGSLVALAIAVEFAQGFFPPRTVSLNDLVAEGAGILIGAAAWLFAGGRLRATLAGLSGNRGVAVRALALTVVLGYVVLAVYPFDFVVSIDELEARLRGPATGLVFASATCSRMVACVGRIGIEIAAGAAFGVAWYWLRGRATARTTEACCGRRSHGARGSRSCRCSWCRAWPRERPLWHGRPASRWACSPEDSRREWWIGSGRGRGCAPRFASRGYRTSHCWLR